MSEEFLEMAELVKSLVLDQETQLVLYGLYKQATQGDVLVPAPQDPVGLAKYKAWSLQKGKSTSQAQQEYIGLVKSFGSGWGVTFSRPKIEDEDEEPLNPDEELVRNLCEAVKSGNIDVDLASCVSINSQDRQGLTPLHHAVDEGLAEIVKKLIEAGANPNIQDKEGMTPLHYAVELDNAEILQILMGVHGVDLSVKDSDGNTVLGIAQGNCLRLLQV